MPHPGQPPSGTPGPPAGSAGSAADAGRAGAVPSSDPAPPSGSTAEPGHAGTPGDRPPETRRARLLGDLRRDAARGVTTGARAATEMGHAAQALGLAVDVTGLQGPRVLLGQIRGMQQRLPAGDLHGPRETPALVYVFADALGIRPSDDAPMSTVPLFGLHLVLPPLAIARWVYKAGRVEHANLDLVADADRFAQSVDRWTVDDFAGADPKLEVRRAAEVLSPVHVYLNLGFAHLRIESPGMPPLHLKSALPTPAGAFAGVLELMGAVPWRHGLTTALPTDA